MMLQVDPFTLTPKQHLLIAARIRRAPSLDPEKAERLAQGHELVAAMMLARARSTSSPSPARTAR